METSSTVHLETNVRDKEDDDQIYSQMVCVKLQNNLKPNDMPLLSTTWYIYRSRPLPNVFRCGREKRSKDKEFSYAA